MPPESSQNNTRFNYVGEPVHFDGYVDDLIHGVAAVQLSLDGGTTWTDFPTEDAVSELGIRWNFSYIPQKAGRYLLKARALSRSGEPSVTVESFAFDVLPSRSGRSPAWGSIGLRPVGGGSLENARLFRSRELGSMSPEEALTLVNVLGVQSVYDIRDAREVAADPEPSLPGVRMLAVTPNQTKRRRNARQRLVAGVIGEYGEPEERMCWNYRRYAVDYPLIGTVLRSIASQGTKALVHCRNGKDRTGVLCAVALRIAGYDLDFVLDDYLQTNVVNAGCIAREEEELSPGMTAKEHAILMSFLEARPAYLNAFFGEAQERYGSFDGYVRDGLRLTPGQCEVIRSMLA